MEALAALAADVMCRLIIMNFLYNFLYMLPIALAILCQSGCATDREFMQYQKQLEMEVECYKKLEPYFRNNNWTADEIITFANEQENIGFGNTKIIFQMLAHGYYLKGEYITSAEMLQNYFNAEFACGFEIEDLGDQRLAAIGDCLAHLHLSQIYKILGEEDKSKKELNRFGELWAIACPCDDQCEKKRIDFTNKHSW